MSDQLVLAEITGFVKAALRLRKQNMEEAKAGSAAAAATVDGLDAAAVGVAATAAPAESGGGGAASEDQPPSAKRQRTDSGTGPLVLNAYAAADPQEKPPVGAPVLRAPRSQTEARRQGPAQRALKRARGRPPRWPPRWRPLGPARCQWRLRLASPAALQSRPLSPSLKLIHRRERRPEPLHRQVHLRRQQGHTRQGCCGRPLRPAGTPTGRACAAGMGGWGAAERSSPDSVVNSGG